MERWEREGRNDILEWVSVLRGPDGTIVVADFPVAPDGDEVEQCPFLAWENDLAVCEIHALHKQVEQLAVREVVNKPSARPAEVPGIAHLLPL